MLALGADLQILRKLIAGDDLPAGRALDPQSLGYIAFCLASDFEGRLLKNSHGDLLAARDRNDNHDGNPSLTEDAGTSISG